MSRAIAGTGKMRYAARGAEHWNVLTVKINRELGDSLKPLKIGTYNQLGT